jgi:hypothetical protein
VNVVELARVMGTSVRMIERHYWALLDGAHTVIASRLDALEAELERPWESDRLARGSSSAPAFGNDARASGLIASSLAVLPW